MHVVQIPAEDARRQDALLRDARGHDAGRHLLRARVNPYLSKVHSIDAAGKDAKVLAPLAAEEAGVDTDDLVDLQAANRCSESACKGEASQTQWSCTLRP